MSLSPVARWPLAGAERTWGQADPMALAPRSRSCPNPTPASSDCLLCGEKLQRMNSEK